MTRGQNRPITETQTGFFLTATADAAKGTAGRGRPEPEKKSIQKPGPHDAVRADKHPAYAFFPSLKNPRTRKHTPITSAAMAAISRAEPTESSATSKISTLTVGEPLTKIAAAM